MRYTPDGFDEIKIIGIDCSASPGKTGLALAIGTRDQLSIVKVKNDSGARKGTPAESPLSILLKWLAEDEIDILAFDAPLGWPKALGEALASHTAGEPLPQAIDDVSSAHGYFRRETDNAIHIRLGKRPLDVGADRIGRTAHAMLKLLGDLRKNTGRPIPLAWNHEALNGLQAIEVYPAATRKARGQTKESPLLEGLGRVSTESVDLGNCTSHELDAIVCAVAGWDFVRGDARGPTKAQLPQALREGWIWAAH